MASKKVLFFVAGNSPSKEDKQAAKEIEGNVMFRNALRVPHDGSLEACDAVTGVVPERYAVAYEHIGSVVIFENEGEKDPADMLLSEDARDALGIEDKDLSVKVDEHGSIIEIPSSVDPYQTPVSTSQRLQAKAVAQGKGVQPQQTGKGLSGEMKTDPDGEGEVSWSPNAATTDAGKEVSERTQDKLNDPQLQALKEGWTAPKKAAAAKAPQKATPPASTQKPA